MRRPLLSLLLASAVLAAAPVAALAQTPPAVAAAPAKLIPAAPDTRPIQYGRFTVEVTGRGPDVILIPGLSSSRESFDALVAARKGHYRFHRIQIAGFAGTPAGDNASGEVVAPTVEAIDRYIHDKGLKAPAVIGHSLGGETALALAARHPGDVGKVMVVERTPLSVPLLGEPTATPRLLGPTAEGIAKGMASSDDARWEKASWDNSAPLVTDPAHQLQVAGWVLASDRSVSGRAFRDLVLLDLRPELAKITAPVTVLYAHGPQFPQTPEQTTAFIEPLYANLKGAKLIRIEPSRHFIMFDQPERFLKEADAFLKN